MADDELDEDLDDEVEEIEEDLDEEFAEADDFDGGDAEILEPDGAAAEEDEGEEEVAAPAARKKREDDEDEDDDEDLSPDDVEADLDTILRDRIAASDDEDDDEEDDEVVAAVTPEGTASVAPKRAGEFTCPACFLLVSRAQFGRPDDPRCPVGNEPCPAIEMAFGSG